MVVCLFFAGKGLRTDRGPGRLDSLDGNEAELQGSIRDRLVDGARRCALDHRIKRTSQ